VQDDRPTPTLLKARTYLKRTVEHLREGLVAPPINHFNLAFSWSVAVDTDAAEAIVRVAKTEKTSKELACLAAVT